MLMSVTNRLVSFCDTLAHFLMYSKYITHRKYNLSTILQF